MYDLKRNKSVRPEGHTASSRWGHTGLPHGQCTSFRAVNCIRLGPLAGGRLLQQLAGAHSSLRLFPARLKGSLCCQRSFFLEKKKSQTFNLLSEDTDTFFSFLVYRQATPGVKAHNLLNSPSERCLLEVCAIEMSAIHIHCFVIVVSPPLVYLLLKNACTNIIVLVSVQLYIVFVNICFIFCRWKLAYGYNLSDLNLFKCSLNMHCPLFLE